jgi:hypothetical protein
MATQPTDLDTVKTESLALGYTKIQAELENARVVSLKDWQGISSHVTGGMYAQVDYYLEGNKSDGHKVRVHKAMEDGNHWYILSR